MTERPKQDRITRLRLIEWAQIGKREIHLQISNILGGLGEDKVLEKTISRRKSHRSLVLTPRCSFAITCPAYKIRSSPSLLRAGTPSKRSRTQPSRVSKLFRDKTTSFERFAQYLVFHHSINSALGSLRSRRGAFHNVSRVPMGNR